MKQPRDPHSGRFVCVPAFPRKRTSRCGCGGGGDHPCAIGQGFRPIHDAARRRYRPTRPSPADVEEIERELYAVDAEREALTYALDYVRAQIEAGGSVYHHAKSGRHASGGGYGGATVDIGGAGDSEEEYHAALEERTALLAHDWHLRDRARDLRAQLRDARRPKAARRGRRVA